VSRREVKISQVLGFDGMYTTRTNVTLILTVPSVQQCGLILVPDASHHLSSIILRLITISSSSKAISSKRS